MPPSDGPLPGHRVDVRPGRAAELRFAGSRDDCANLTLLIDCLNFCFWSDEPWSVEFAGRTWTRTYAMYAGVLRAVAEDSSWLTPQRWAAANSRDVLHVFRGQGRIPLADKRVEVLNETGRCLLESFDGCFANAVEQADGRARRLAYLVADRFPSFRDAPTYQGRTVAILKRAQICAADLHHNWARCALPSLSGLDELTIFADYRLPQYLRHIGVMVLSPRLAERIDAEQLIEAESEEEIELRCATVAASDLLREELRRSGVTLPAWHLDYVLWERSHDPEINFPHHRTQTVYY